MEPLLDRCFERKLNSVFNEKLYKIWKERKAYHEERSLSGSRGNEIRWAKRHRSANAKGSQDVIAERSHPSPSPLLNKKPPFIPPTEADALSYFTEKGVNGDHWRVFMNYYLEKDWKDVKDWRRRADTWIIRGRSRGEIPEARGNTARIYIDEEGNPL